MTDPLPNLTPNPQPASDHRLRYELLFELRAARREQERLEHAIRASAAWARLEALDPLLEIDLQDHAAAALEHAAGRPQQSSSDVLLRDLRASYRALVHLARIHTALERGDFDRVRDLLRGRVAGR